MDSERDLQKAYQKAYNRSALLYGVPTDCYIHWKLTQQLDAANARLERWEVVRMKVAQIKANFYPNLDSYVCVELNESRCAFSEIEKAMPPKPTEDTPHDK
jgi:hypothetical protein